MNDILPFPTHTLPHLGSILVSGTDARDYLQGQLSFDMARLTPGRIELATCNSAQGRVQAVLWMIERSDGIALILPAELVDAIVTRLRKYTLRSRVRIESGAGRIALGGSWDETRVEAPRSHIERDGTSFVRWHGVPARTLVVAPASVPMQDDTTALHSWRIADIRAGLPQVWLQTHESFVAQMLNVDLLEGISFEKGCYTGQEIIARTHFRGTVKRRMFRFGARCSPPVPGTRVLAGDTHAGDVVDAAMTAEGAELLAVVSLQQADAALRLDSTADSELTRLSLPYEVTSREG
ncbi:MAG TPA: hypothetical protein VKB34_07165 [Povalibacter sp.]|nr:hypothetical protein [Povalibacter sp.]